MQLLAIYFHENRFQARQNAEEDCSLTMEIIADIALYLLMSLPLIMVIVVICLIVYWHREHKRIDREARARAVAEAALVASGEYEWRTIRVWNNMKKYGLPLDFPTERVLVKKGTPRLKGEISRSK